MPYLERDCPPEDLAVQIAQQADLPFILVVLHKGHYIKYTATGQHDGASPKGGTAVAWVAGTG